MIGNAALGRSIAFFTLRENVNIIIYYLFYHSLLLLLYYYLGGELLDYSIVFLFFFIQLISSLDCNKKNKIRHMYVYYITVIKF